ncbi:MAG: hypothetical protein CME59_06780 [Halioglobus sp.]|nr:hypothetical protein [Halioglobus sp.]|tara:strand:- start:599 stop:802 length:204 start_codon:yes stop_codon:yes gene_type:complete
MNKNLVFLGSIVGIMGAVLCFLAGLARIAGYYYVLGYQSTTLFNVGVGVMVFACLLKLEEMAARHRE